MARDYRKREDRIDRLRREAMIEIWTELGFEGVKELLIGSGAAGTVGHYVALCVTDVKPRVDFIQRCLSVGGDIQSKAEWCLRGFLLALKDNSSIELLQATSQELPPEELSRLFELKRQTEQASEVHSFYLNGATHPHSLGFYWKYHSYHLTRLGLKQFEKKSFHQALISSSYR